MALERKIFNFDVETTGLYANVNGIVQLAGVIEIGDKIVEEFDIRMRPFPNDIINDKALEIQGRTREEILSWPPPEVAHDQLIKLLDKYVDRYDSNDKFYPCGYNIAFDTSFIIQFCQKNGNQYIGSWLKLNSQIDPLYILRMMDFMGKISLPNYKLETVCKALDIPIKAHDALSDIRATVEIRKVIEALLECE